MKRFLLLAAITTSLVACADPSTPKTAGGYGSGGLAPAATNPTLAGGHGSGGLIPPATNPTLAGGGNGSGGVTAPSIPPAEADALARIEKSPRHGEWVDITVPGHTTPMKTYIVYPERPDKAPVVIVIMEIYGLSDWLRATSDQLAADGFIAVAPDFVSGKGPNGAGSEAFTKATITRVVSGTSAAEVIDDVNAARDFALKLPSASGKSATVGFCWGGGMSFAYAAAQPNLNAAAVFYGTPPADNQLPNIKAPIIGFYGGNDNRVTSTVAPTIDKMKAQNKSFDPHIEEGAGHGFMRAHAPSDPPANQKAAADAWPLLLQFLRDNTK